MSFRPIANRDEFPGCTHPQCEPPNLVAVTEFAEWVCPGCGSAKLMFPFIASIDTREKVGTVQLISFKSLKPKADEPEAFVVDATS